MPNDERRGGGKGGEEGIRPVSRPHRKVQSTDAQRCIGNAPIRGQFALCSLRERDGRTKETRGFPGTEHGAPSSSNYQAFISWKTSLSLSLSLCFVYCHRWPFRSSVWCNQKNRASKDWPALLAWEIERKRFCFFWYVNLSRRKGVSVVEMIVLTTIKR